MNKDENTSSDKLNEEDDDNQIKIDLTSMLDIINKNNSFELLKLSSFLSNYNYEILSREQDKKEKEIFVLTSSNFLLPYLNKLLSQNTNDQNEQKIKYNIISSIINIISFFSDKIDLKLIYKKILSEVFNQYLVNYIKEKNNNTLNQINNKIILLVFDLFQLFIDIMKEEEKINTKSNLINYDKIIDVLIKEYLFNL